MTVDDRDITNTGVIDFGLYIKRKRGSDCQHEYVNVDDSAASLTCRTCDAELDPWWYLRRLAHDGEQEAIERWKHRIEHDAWVKNANEKIQRLQGEINQLTETKNRLYNEQINGTRLGLQVRRRRTRSSRPA